MKGKLIHEYSEGSDNVWISGCAGADHHIIVGCTKVEDKYRILVSKLDKSGSILWNKTYGGDSEYEGRVMLKMDGSYLIGGNAHGIATESGGMDWQGYLLKIDKDGNKIFDRSYKIGENDAIYSFVEKDGHIFCLGESTTGDEKYIFVMELDENLEIRDVWKYGGYEDVLAGGLSKNLLAFSFKTKNRWYGKIMKFDDKFHSLWERTVEGLQIYSLTSYDNYALISGERDGKAYASKIEVSGKIIWEKEFEKGTFMGVAVYDENTLLCGEINGKATAYLVNEDGEIIDEYIAPEMNGWFENALPISENTAILLGYSPEDGSAAMILTEAGKDL